MNDDIQFGVPSTLENPGLTPQQEFELLKQRIPKILKRRVFAATVFSLLWPGIAALMYFRGDSNDYAVFMIPMFLFLMTISIVSLVIEIINVKRPRDWYQAINFLIWNIPAQISTMSERARARDSKWKAIGAIVRFDPKDAVTHTLDHFDARRDADRAVDSYRDTQVVDKYLELRRTLEFVTPPTR